MGADRGGRTERAAAPSLLDEALLDQLREVPGQRGPTMLHDVVPDFVATLDRQVASIREAFDAGELDAGARGAHALAGSLGTLGARDAATAMADIEAQARAGRPRTRLLTALAEVEPLLERTVAALRVAVADAAQP